MITIGTDTFIVPVPPAMRSFSLQQRIIPVAGRVAAALLSVVGKSKVADLNNLLESDIMDALPVALPMLGHVFSEMPHGELEYLTQTLLGDSRWVRQGGAKEGIALFAPGGNTFDNVMQGRHIDTWRLLWHALEVWYPDFFDRVRKLRAPDKKDAPSTASTTLDPAGPATA